MGKHSSVEAQQRLEKFLEHLEAARELQRNWMTYGLDCVNIYVEDVDEDWWEKWAEEEHQSFVDSVIEFLKSDDWLAVRVRKQLANKPILEIAEKLEKYLSFPEEERIFAIKNFLASRFTVEEINRNISNESEEMELRDLAAELLKKLVEIQGNNVEEFR
ncbi:hypothetical protein BV372_10275 [Nostoc sp. T09]|uniref:hypothetical protein n=1 Tax=Nostoc sp. T09 TaxID=1932621 RepID=UPI000A3672AD|nr:hypothetical protein [Nostoc sp. T09]OUL35677.1 hypothetical protein BV372_10275 [Nostoc sp. T09]